MSALIRATSLSPISRTSDALTFDDKWNLKQ